MVDLVYNKELQANNVFEFDIDYDKALQLVQPYVEELDNSTLFDADREYLHLKDLSLPFYAKLPHWNGDISWVSAASKETFHFFDTCFKELEIAEKTQRVANLNFPLILYSGYFVIRSYGRAPHFHEDYLGSGINAFTLMTPIQIDEASSGHLWYINTSGKAVRYRYKKGKAILFGSDFVHSTEPFKSKLKYIFLCFTYGSTDLEMWEKVKGTAMYQGVSYRDPKGNIVVVTPEFEQYF